MKMGWLTVAFALFLPQAEAATVKLERLRSRDAVIEEKIAAGRQGIWVLRRDSRSFRGQTRIDGIIVVDAATPLRFKAIRRRDGDHEFLLGDEGKPPEPIVDLQSEISNIHRMHLVPHQLVKGETPLAILYVPPGAWLRAIERSQTIEVDLELPWEPGKFRDDFQHRKRRSSF